LAYGEYKPSVSILISAYNEEKVIEQRVKNIFDSKYPLDKIEILIGSDCAIDSTNAILQNLANQFSYLKIFLFEERRGKAAVLNDLVKEANNEILIFTDANTEFDRNAISNLVKGFSVPKVGGVSGRLILTDEAIAKSEGVEEAKYWKLETYLKKAEGKIGILIGANGGIFAIRKNLFETIPLVKAVTDDLYISLSVLNKGYKFLYCEDAIAKEDVGKTVVTEYKRKIRFISTNFQTALYLKSLLLNKNILLSYAFWSHKVLRWFLPIKLILIFLICLILFKQSVFYLYFFLIQLIILILGAIGFILYKLKFRIAIFSIPFFFLMTNLALILGIVRFIRGKHSIIWQSTER
jgi:cellulose synthase/poly-beta-1,6-N-acetylglucosamine synthase-like glycosyltransferase